ncbi:SGNH/GDSL hydrolase family protein [Blastococcus sp. SYSU D00695]
MGDSLTAGVEPLAGTRVPHAWSWLPGAVGEPLDYRGGWAVPGARTDAMLAGTGRVEADVLVVLAGTNDLIGGIPWDTSRDNLREIVERIGVDDVLVVAVPPLDPAPAAAAEYDARLAELATDEGWQYLDPWDEATDGDRWATGASADGVHPTEPVAERAGGRIRSALLDRAADGDD